MNTLAADVDSEERDINLPFAEGVNLPEFPKAINGCLHILFIPTKNRPIMKSDPNLVSEAAPRFFLNFHLVREREVNIVEPERVAAYCRFSSHPVRKEDRQRWRLERGHLIV